MMMMYIIILNIIVLFVGPSASIEPPLPWATSKSKKPCCNLDSLYPMHPKFPPRSDFKYKGVKKHLGNHYTLLNMKREELDAIKTKHFIIKWNPTATTKSLNVDMAPGKKFPWNTRFVIQGPHCPPYKQQPCCKLKVHRQHCCRPCKVKAQTTTPDPGVLPHHHHHPMVLKRVTCGSYFATGFVCAHPLRPTPLLARNCDHGRGRHPCKSVCCKAAVDHSVHKFKCYKWYQLKQSKACAKHKVRRENALMKQCSPFGGKRVCRKICCRKRSHTCHMYFKNGNHCIRGTVKRRKIRHVLCSLSSKGQKSCRTQCCRLRLHKKLQNKIAAVKSLGKATINMHAKKKKKNKRGHAVKK